MEPQSPSAKKIHQQFGILAGVILVVVFVVYYVFGLMSDSMLRWIPSVILLVLIIIAQQTYAKAVEGNTTFGNLFGIGFKATAIATCIYLAFFIIFLIAVPAFKEHSLVIARQQMEAKGNMTEEQITTGLNWYRKSFTVIMIAGAIFGNLVVGLIASLIGAALAKKNPRPTTLP